MSASAVLAALQTILPAGTTIATTVVQKGLNTQTQAFPAIILNVPTTERRRTANHAKQWVHSVHVLYLDRWESSTRSLETALADADTALDAMVANLEANPTLTVASVSHCMQAGETLTKLLDGAVQDENLGFPLIQGQLIIEVQDFWETVT